MLERKVPTILCALGNIGNLVTTIPWHSMPLFSLEPCSWKNELVGSAGQTTMLNRCESKLGGKSSYQFPNIFDSKSASLGKLASRVSWPECQPYFTVERQVGWIKPRFEPWAQFVYDLGGSVRYDSEFRMMARFGLVL